MCRCTSFISFSGSESLAFSDLPKRTTADCPRQIGRSGTISQKSARLKIYCIKMTIELTFEKLCDDMYDDRWHPLNWTLWCNVSTMLALHYRFGSEQTFEKSCNDKLTKRLMLRVGLTNNNRVVCARSALLSISSSTGTAVLSTFMSQAKRQNAYCWIFSD